MIRPARSASIVLSRPCRTDLRFRFDLAVAIRSRSGSDLSRGRCQRFLYELRRHDRAQVYDGSVWRRHRNPLSPHDIHAGASRSAVNAYERGGQVFGRRDLDKFLSEAWKVPLRGSRSVGCQSRFARPQAGLNKFLSPSAW